MNLYFCYNSYEQIVRLRRASIVGLTRFLAQPAINESILQLFYEGKMSGMIPVQNLNVASTNLLNLYGQQ